MDFKKIKEIVKPKKKNQKRTSEMQIGMPTNVTRDHHVEHTEQGLVGLPEEFQNLLRHMLTEKELTEDKTVKAAENVLIWNQKHQEKIDTGGFKIIKTDFSPGCSGELRSSGVIEPRDSEVRDSSFYVPTPSVNDNESPKPSDHPDVDNDNNQDLEKPTPTTNANTNVTTPVPLRRKNTNKAGPRVTRNMTEDEVMNEIRDLCELGQPLDKYDTDIELGAGAAGTVFLAVNKETKERVAIKKIDMVKQQKKEMILMEIKVS